MADSYGEREIDSAEEPLLSGPKKGGIRTLPFIIANEALESLASFGLSPNMTRYLMGDYGMSAAQTSNVLFLWASANGTTTVFEAFLADSYFGRYQMIAYGTVFSLLGMILLWLTATIPQARPSCHKFTGSCDSPTGFHLLLLFSSFGLMSIGSGGIRGSSLAFGGNQLNSNSHKNAGVLERFIGWYYVGTLVGTMLGTTVIVYIQDKYGWNVGFGIPVVLMFLSMVSFLVASPYYVKMKPTSNFFSGLLQVIIASYRKRNLKLSPDGLNEVYHHSSEATLLKPTQNLRFLNKACIIRNPEEEDASDRWSLCTVDQVEDFKSIIGVIPIWIAGIMFSVSFSQNTLPYLQVSTMDRHMGDFEIPAGSFSIFLFISIGLWVFLYDRLFVPVATKIRGKPTRMTPKQKIGFGILLSSLSLAASAIVESQRRAIAIEEGFSDNPHAIVKMSAFWLLPNYVLGGISDASCIVGLNEFFYSELPKSMSSIAIALAGLCMAVGNLVASFVMTTVDSWTRAGGGESWVSSNLNKGHYDYFYWLLCGFCFLNFLYFVACSRSYGPGKGEKDELS